MTAADSAERFYTLENNAARTESPEDARAQDSATQRAWAMHPKQMVFDGAAQESEIPNFKSSDLGHFPLVSADFWTSDHLSERSRRVDVISVTRARGTLTLKRC